MINSTCYKCTDRYIGCHAKCKKYENFKKELAEIKEKKKIKEDQYACFKRRYQRS